MTNNELTELINEISETAFRKPFRHQGVFNARLRTTGGRYLLRSHNIEINPKSYEKFGLTELEGIINTSFAITIYISKARDINIGMQISDSC